MTGSAERLSPAPGTQELADIEVALKGAWTGANSTPYLVEAPIDGALRARAEHAVRTRRLSNLFFSYPTLATWGVLAPLALSYGPDRLVYSHISAFTGESFDDLSSRDALKQRYRTAARKLGLPVSGNDPTSLFFAPLGPARAHHGDLAAAFVAAALSLGPPAIEDTPSARGWQRRAVAMRCQAIARLCATVAFDQSAWLATRFEAWRRGEAPISDGEAHLFAAYETATGAFGRRRSDIVGPPRLAWTGFGLAFEPEASSRAQSLRFGAIATPIAGGGRVALPAPWRERVAWTCGGVSSEIPGRSRARRGAGLRRGGRGAARPARGRGRARRPAGRAPRGRGTAALHGDVLRAGDPGRGPLLLRRLDRGRRPAGVRGPRRRAPRRPRARPAGRGGALDRGAGARPQPVAPALCRRRPASPAPRPRGRRLGAGDPRQGRRGGALRQPRHRQRRPCQHRLRQARPRRAGRPGAGGLRGPGPRLRRRP